MLAARRLLLAIVYLWVLPNSVLGLLSFALGLLAGARGRWVDGVLEVSGPGVCALLELMPARHPIAAITLGHVVLGRDPGCLERTRAHERVHVGQYQRWGPAFLPAYLLASLLARLSGGDAYLDNRFERQAYGLAPCGPVGGERG
jgi:hypothetical protein